MRIRAIGPEGMRVFSLWDPKNPMREVDLFIEHPMPFEEVWTRSVEVKLDDIVVRIASLEDLIALKRLAGRPQDLKISKHWKKSVSDREIPPSEESPKVDAVGGWEDTRAWRIDLTLAATAAQRLEWLEQAIVLAHKAGALPRPR